MTQGPLAADDIRRLFGELAPELDAAGQRAEVSWSAVPRSRCALTRGGLRVTWTRYSRPPILCAEQQQSSPIVKDSILTG
jgi:hypothetical protein